VKFISDICIELPAWIEGYVDQWSGQTESAEDALSLAIALSAENVKRETGGPFGAVVADESSGRVLGVGVNSVTAAGLSLAHAEMVAISQAQAAIGHWNLASAGSMLLATSCEPCAMCYGAVPWSGIKTLVWGARREDAEACGFDEGEKPDDWQAALNRRGIRTIGELLRDEAAEILRRYARFDGEIYHPAKSDGIESC
jgi:tRNA(Arg) A34 adenosine deaminase TadA